MFCIIIYNFLLHEHSCSTTDSYITAESDQEIMFDLQKLTNILLINPEKSAELDNLNEDMRNNNIEDSNEEYQNNTFLENTIEGMLDEKTKEILKTEHYFYTSYQFKKNEVIENFIDYILMSDEAFIINNSIKAKKIGNNAFIVQILLNNNKMCKSNIKNKILKLNFFFLLKFFSASYNDLNFLNLQFIERNSNLFDTTKNHNNILETICNIKIIDRNFTIGYKEIIVDYENINDPNIIHVLSFAHIHIIDIIHIMGEDINYNEIDFDTRGAKSLELQDFEKKILKQKKLRNLLLTNENFSKNDRNQFIDGDLNFQTDDGCLIDMKNAEISVLFDLKERKKQVNADNEIISSFFVNENNVKTLKNYKDTHKDFSTKKKTLYEIEKIQYDTNNIDKSYHNMNIFPRKNVENRTENNVKTLEATGVKLRNNVSKLSDYSGYIDNSCIYKVKYVSKDQNILKNKIPESLRSNLKKSYKSVFFYENFKKNKPNCNNKNLNIDDQKIACKVKPNEKEIKIKKRTDKKKDLIKMKYKEENSNNQNSRYFQYEKNNENVSLINKNPQSYIDQNGDYYNYSKILNVLKCCSDSETIDKAWISENKGRFCKKGCLLNNKNCHRNKRDLRFRQNQGKIFKIKEVQSQSSLKIKKKLKTFSSKNIKSNNIIEEHNQNDCNCDICRTINSIKNLTIPNDKQLDKRKTFSIKKNAASLDREPLIYDNINTRQTLTSCCCIN